MNPIYQIPATDHRVDAAIAWVKSHLSSDGVTVEKFDGTADGPYPLEIHTVTFSRNGKSCTVIAGLLALYAWVTIGDLRAAGIV